jgi:phosphate transport system substrate-binding protein
MKIFSALLFVIGMLCFVLVTAAEAGGLNLPLSPTDYPMVDGSTSTQPLSVLIACRLTHTAFTWGSHPFNRTRMLYPTTEAYDSTKRLDLKHSPAPASLAPRLPASTLTSLNNPLMTKVRHSGTHESYINLINRQAQLILAAREPSDDELALAKQKGVEIKALPIALDALVFIRNANNPVSAITTEQIRGIYTGKITHWKALGGPDLRINPYRRNRNSGSEETMQKIVMRGQKMMEARDLEVAMSMIGPFNAIREDRLGIGYTVYYYDTFMTSIPEVRMLAVDGVFPDRRTIGDQSYPFATEVFIAYLNDLPQDSVAASIRDWLLSREGQSVVSESGYAPIKKTRQ